MAAIASNTKCSFHIRCNSVPSASHPLVSQFEEHLNRLKSSESASSSSLSSKLRGLQDLLECTDKMLQLPMAHQACAREYSDKSADELLDGSLRLLDICSIAKDCLLQSRESMNELHSIIRRRKGAEKGFTIDGEKYLASRKKMKKAIQKALGSSKGAKTISSANKENEDLVILRMLKEAEAVTLSTLESLLYNISDLKGQTKQSRFPAICKLIQPKRVVCDSQESVTNEFVMVDASLQPLNCQRPISADNFQSNLKNLEMCIKDLEIEVEHLSRQLIRNRVSLLNIFNH